MKIQAIQKFKYGGKRIGIGECANVRKDVAETLIEKGIAKPETVDVNSLKKGGEAND